MSFILHNESFNIIISVLLFLNIIFTFILSIGDLKKDLNKNNKKDELSKIQMFKFIVIIIYILFFAIILMKITTIYNIYSYLKLIYYFSFALATIRIFNKSIKDLTSENKMIYLMTTALFSILFSSNASQLYLSLLVNIKNSIKEYLLLMFLSIKILFFIFCVIINLSILASNFTILFNKTFKKGKELFNKFLNKEFELRLYDFYLSSKYSKKLFALDIIIFIILCPFQLVIYFILAFIVFFIRFLLKKLLDFGNMLSNYFDNSQKIISKALKISIIFSLLTVYVVATYNPKIICNNTKDVYNLLVTVILIPIVYDSIKSKL